MTRTCLSLTGSTLKENIDCIIRYRRWIDLAELRLDFLEPAELEDAASFPSRTGGLPIILTIRKTGDGGFFPGGERERKKLFLRCLSGKVSYRYVDIEEDFNDRDITNLLEQEDIRIIRSFHDFNGVPENLTSRISRLRQTGKEILKAAVMPRNTADVVTVFEAMKHFKGEDTIILGMGEQGFPTRILAPLSRGFLTYTSRQGREAAPGHIDPEKLHQLYRFSTLSESTKVFGIIGNPVMHSYSPVIHNTGLAESGYNGVYIPFQIDSIESFSRLSSLIGVEGFSVTHPFKEKIIGFLRDKGEDVEKIGACNTVRRKGVDWEGENFDWSGFLEPLKEILQRERNEFTEMRATVVGAGGAARAVVYALRKAGMHVLILNRTEERGRNLAGEFGCECSTLGDMGMEKVGAYADLIVQATSLGMYPHEEKDPLIQYSFQGHEIVYDLIYEPEKTKLLQRAEQAGCRILNGKQMLLQQAYSQFEYFTGLPYPVEKREII